MPFPNAYALNQRGDDHSSYSTKHNLYPVPLVYKNYTTDREICIKYGFVEDISSRTALSATSKWPWNMGDPLFAQRYLLNE